MAVGQKRGKPSQSGKEISHLNRNQALSRQEIKPVLGT